jgi:hypothetical protein
MPVISAIQKAVIGRMVVQASLGKNVSKSSILTNKLDVMAHDCHPHVGGSQFRLAQANNARPYLKSNSKQKRPRVWLVQ